MSAKKLITVFGATGKQGGSILSTIFTHPKLNDQFSIRGITRDPNGRKAQSLVQKYSNSTLEFVAGDLNDTSCLNSALAGSYAVFMVTNYWELMSKDKEVAQGKALADAAVETQGLKHVIWSSLPNVSKLTNGVLSNVHHFDGKAEVEEYFEQVKAKNPGMAVTYFQPGFYVEQIKSSTRKNEQTGKPTLTSVWDYETTWVSFFDPAKDTGKFVAGILDTQLSGKEDLDGKHIHAVSEWGTPKQVLDTVKEVAGTEIAFQQVPSDVYQSFLPPAVALDLVETMLVIKDYSYYGKGSNEQQAEHNRVLEALDLKPTTLKEFVEANKPWEF